MNFKEFLNEGRVPMDKKAQEILDAAIEQLNKFFPKIKGENASFNYDDEDTYGYKLTPRKPPKFKEKLKAIFADSDRFEYKQAHVDVTFKDTKSGKIISFTNNFTLFVGD